MLYNKQNNYSMNSFDTKEIKTFEELKALLTESSIAYDLEIIESAYNFAASIHANDARASGEPYETHILTVAKYIVQMQLDTITVICGLIHDTVTKEEVSIDLVDKKFGEEAAFILDGLKELQLLAKNYNSDEGEKSEFKNLIFNSSEDIRIIIVRIADRLHNILTIQHLPQSKQRLAAEKTLQIYAPLASYLGLGAIQTTLEDLAFQLYLPEKFEIMRKQIDEVSKKSSNILDDFQIEANKLLKDYNVKNYELYGRKKGIYSAYRKVKLKYSKGNNFEDANFTQLRDIHAFRLIVETLEACYIVLGLLHSKFQYSNEDFRDYISIPKENGYKSIHTVLEYQDTFIEVQIRTQEMHQYNEYGPASHIAYKLSGLNATKSTLTWTKDIINWKSKKGSNKDAFKLKAFTESVFCFTPKGLVIKLKKGSTPLDFAFRVHTRIGERYQGALVNGKMENMEHELKTGDVVEVLTTKKMNVRRDWLNYAKSHKARAKIRRILRNQV